VHSARARLFFALPPVPPPSQARGAAVPPGTRRPSPHFTAGSSATPCGVVGAVREPPLHRVRPRPPMSAGEGFARWSEWTECCRLFATEQQRDASPSQGEAGAQRRVRVGCVGDRGSTHSLTFHPLPRPSQGEGEESTSLGATE
jgi:hypothetical protein